MNGSANEAGQQSERMLRVREAYLRTRELRSRLAALRSEDLQLPDSLSLSLSERAERQAADRERLDAERATKLELDAAERALSDAEAAVQESLSGNGDDWMRGTGTR
ncbi:hypothetical protein [Pseudoclavibacter sp. AY1H1]|uniref:hypothetical protein n=1 Tax=Pseudoclavibacter sp. AY1H1 TaxID=2080584 RepID=UPI0011B046BC|nr:hypothetical protein [Pseudoclavibacter sp. AY1H1]